MSGMTFQEGPYWQCLYNDKDLKSKEDCKLEEIITSVQNCSVVSVAQSKCQAFRTASQATQPALSLPIHLWTYLLSPTFTLLSPLSPWPSKNLPGSFLPQGLFIWCSLTYSLPYLLWVLSNYHSVWSSLTTYLKLPLHIPSSPPSWSQQHSRKSLSCLHFPIGVSSSILHSLLLNSVYHLFLTMDLFFMPRIVPSHSRHLRNCLNDWANELNPGKFDHKYALKDSLWRMKDTLWTVLWRVML